MDKSQVRQFVAARDVVVRDPRHTTCSGARHTRSSSVAEIQHKSPGRCAPIALATLSERQLCIHGSNYGGNPPFFDKHAFLFSSGKSDTDNLLKNRLKWDKVPYSKKFLKNGKHF